jgi:hypothetical protein
MPLPQVAHVSRPCKMAKVVVATADLARLGECLALASLRA